jgi:hypothetical protein
LLEIRGFVLKHISLSQNINFGKKGPLRIPVDVSRLISRKLPNFIRNTRDLLQCCSQILRLKTERHSLRPFINVRSHQLQPCFDSKPHFFFFFLILEFSFLIITNKYVFLHLLLPFIHCKHHYVIWTILEDTSSDRWQLQISTRCNDGLVVKALMLSMYERGPDQFISQDLLTVVLVKCRKVLAFCI